MSWSIEEHIGEGRPWPEQVVVYRGETDESLTYARRSLSDVNKMVELMDTLAAENAKLREMARNLHVAYVGTLNECEGLNEGLIYEYSGSVDADVAKSRAKFKADRHRFDAALRELGVEVDG